MRLVVDICKPRGMPPGNHYMVPRAAATSDMLPEDMAALQAKGCFSLPTEEVQHALLRSYFHHVHHFLPIIDATKFLMQYESGGAKNIYLLLVWSMFFAATNVRRDLIIVAPGSQMTDWQMVTVLR